MSTNLYDAHRQWAYRPKDERFGNLEELYNFTRARKLSSEQRVSRLDKIAVLSTEAGGIAINGSSEQAELSNWAFGQLSSSVGAPASYLRTLPAEMAVDCLQYGLSNSDQNCKLLIRNHTDYSQRERGRIASAFTGPKYGRIWDADVLESLMNSVQDSSWHVPPARPNHGSENSGLYASDHDMFVFLVNDEKPVEVENSRLGRGFFCWNSETGSSTFGLTTFLYNYICGNHIVWGAEQVNELKIIHRTHAPDHFYSAALPILNEFVEDRGNRDNVTDTVYSAMKEKSGDTLDQALDYFKPRPFTRKEITNAWEQASSSGEDPRTLWGMIQGLTAYARDMPFCDKRVNLERRAGGLLAY